ncbi:MAG: type IV pilus inner membrane component PilO [Candidatus Methylomirabilia bacterium]
MAQPFSGAAVLAAWGKVPPRTRVLLFAVLVALVFWLGLMVFVVPRRAARLQLEEQIGALVPVTASLRQQIDALRVAASGEDAVQRALAETRRQLEETLARVPDHRDLSSFLRNLTAPETEDGVAFLSITPLPAEPRGELQELPFTLELEGTYQSLTRYLTRLEALPRLVTVRSVTLGAASGKQFVLRASIVAATYVLGKSP